MCISFHLDQQNQFFFAAELNYTEKETHTTWPKKNENEEIYHLTVLLISI